MRTEAQVCTFIPHNDALSANSVDSMTKFTMSLTPWSRVRQKLEVYQVVMKFLTFYGAQKYIVVLTTAHHILSQMNSIYVTLLYFSQLYLYNTGCAKILCASDDYNTDVRCTETF